MLYWYACFYWKHHIVHAYTDYNLVAVNTCNQITITVLASYIVNQLL